MYKNYIGELVLDQVQIQEGVNAVAQQLNEKFSKQTAVIITVVPGGILFTADLVRQLNFSVAMDYISCPHTPGARSNHSPIVYHQNIKLAERHVILIDDAIESGGTMQRLVAYLSENFRIKSLSIATLLVKKNRVKIPVDQYFAYEIASDDLLVGYGLPWQEEGRNLPFIAKVIQGGIVWTMVSPSHHG